MSFGIAEHLWSSVVHALNTLQVAHLTAIDKIAHTNELIETLPLNNSMASDMSGQDIYKNNFRQLYSNLNDVKIQAEEELK